jgi:hypothetical protein
MGSEGTDSIGRLRRLVNAHDTKTLEYLAFISAKYDVDFEELFNGIVDAWNRESSSCGDLQIKCRGKFRDKTVFLITRDEDVATQFRLPERLLEKSDLIGDFKPDMRLHPSSWKKYRATHQ